MTYFILLSKRKTCKIGLCVKSYVKGVMSYSESISADLTNCTTWFIEERAGWTGDLARWVCSGAWAASNHGARASIAVVVLVVVSQLILRHFLLSFSCIDENLLGRPKLTEVSIPGVPRIAV